MNGAVILRHRWCAESNLSVITLDRQRCMPDGKNVVMEPVRELNADKNGQMAMTQFRTANDTNDIDI